jgi:4-amino-4-deoxy-L-arabinose transferase-like glycosyltransferase
MNRRAGWAIGGILAAAAILRGVGLGHLALIGDESYWWLWSRHPDWAYFDHPAGVALLIRLSTVIGGQSELGIRWLNALLGVGSAFLSYKLGERMLSRRAGLFAGLLVAAGAPYLVTSRFVYTDALQLFLLLLNLYWFWRLVEEKPFPRLATAGIFGVSLALLLNTKYSAYLYALALLAAILIDHRRLLTQPGIWLAGLVGALGLLPAVAWNATHDWLSFRWQLAHLAVSVSGDYSLSGNVRHSLAYLSPPLVALALAGVGCLRSPAERLLSFVALFLILPIALSPANSPRNLSSGLVVLLLLAGTRWPATLHETRRRALALLLAGVTVATAIYGAGTVLNLSGPSAWPHSSVAPAIRRDAAGWRDLAPILTAYPSPIFALDYSIASQIQYYTGQPTYTAWGQYRIWGMPQFRDATVVSLDYLPEALVSARLRDAFQRVIGPQRFQFVERGATKEVRIWRAEGLHLDQEDFLHTFDFLTLLEASQ